ncbi:MAG: hypothetical protein ABEH59_14030 [Halobacteriales archaeon]
MTRDETDALDGEITTEAEFERTLECLLLNAVGNDVDPQGAWEYRNGPRAPDLEVLVSELAGQGGSD